MSDAMRAHGARRTFGVVVTLLAIALTIDTVVALMRGWSPLASRIDLGAVIALGLFIAAVLLSFGVSPLRRFVLERWRGFASVGLSSLVTIFVIELVLSAFGDRIDRAPFHGHPRGLRQTFHADLAGTSPNARFSVDSLGLRGTEPPTDPGVFRILCVGGSTTEDVYLDDSKTWTRLLAEDLNERGERRYWSASAGRSGYATVEHLRFIEKGSAIGQFDVAVVLVGINDLARFVWGKPADRVAEHAAPLWIRSRILALVKRIWSAYLQPGNLVMDRDALFVRDAQVRRAEGRIVDETADVGPALESYRERLRRIVKVARKRALEIVLVDQPTLFRDELTAEEERRLWFLRREDGTYLPARIMRNLMDRFNLVTAEVAVELHVPLVRLSELDGDPRWFYDDCHFTEAGAAEVARRIAREVDWDSMESRRREASR